MRREPPAPSDGWGWSRLRRRGVQRRSHRHLHRGDGLCGVHLQGAAALAAVQEHHARRRRHGRPRLAARLREVQPAAAPAHHRLDPRLVRRLSGPHLLFPGAHRRHRPPVVHHPVQHRLQAGHRAGTADACRSPPGPSGGLARMRFPGPACLALATLPYLLAGSSPSTAATSPRRWPGEFCFSISLSSPWCSWGWWPGAWRTAGTGPSPPSSWRPAGSATSCRCSSLSAAPSC